MLYRYRAKTNAGEAKSGTIEAASAELAVSALQSRGFIITSLEPAESSTLWYERTLGRFERVKTREIVILSRQLATLFEAKVPVIEALKVLLAETSNPAAKRHLSELLSDIQGGSSISAAMARHPALFSSFYVNMVKSGEESGKLEEIFSYLADYLERSYELESKAKSALIYPAFVFTAFVAVFVLMLVVVIPRLSAILLEAGAQVPIYTRAVIGFSNFLRRFGIFLAVLLAGGIVALWRYVQTGSGKTALSRFLIEIPVFGELYRKFFLARLTDNLETLLSGGVTVLRSLEITADVIGNEVYAQIVREVREQVRGGSPLSAAFARYQDIPSLMSQMMRVGEETGKLEFVLKTMSRFYRREVDNALASMVSLIEPIMIIVLGLGIGFLVASVLLPIYNLSSAL
ncbi:MAG: type II secretion system F family protein [Patescibacteria group bacterium]